VQEHRPVGGGDAAPELPAELGVGDALAAAVGLQQPRQDPGDAGQGEHQRGRVVGAVRVDQHLGVAGGQPVAALGGRALGVVASEVAGHGLLLEPLAGVARGDAGVTGELGLGRRAQLAERPVEAELDAQVYAEGLHRPGQAVDQPLGQRLAGVEVGWGWHGSSLPPAGRSTALPAAASPRSPTARVQPAYTGCTRSNAMMPA
jgi:hypothetical protein